MRDADARIIAGPVVPYGIEARVGRYVETFARGVFDTADPDAVPLLVAHRHASLRVGRTISLTDTTDALVGEFQLTETRDADEVLALAHDDVPLGLSVGFAPVEDRSSRDRTRVVRVRATLGEVSVVGLPAYRDAKVTSVRAEMTVAPRLTIAQLLRP